jgi:hypothetical protein
MTGLFPRLAAVLLWALAAAATAHAQELDRTISGVVRNGTPGATLGAARATLVAPSQGMEEIAAATVTEGRFRFTDIPTGPPVFLVQVEYQGVTYSQPARPTGTPLTVDFEVYEVSDRRDALRVEMRHLVLRTDGRVFQANKLFRVFNEGPERRTVYRPDGAFQLYLPANRVGQTKISISAQGQPVSRDPMPTSDPEVFTVDYPMRPGLTEVEVAYTLPYPEKALHYEERLLYDLPQVDLFVQPHTVQLEPSPPLQVADINEERSLAYLHADAMAAGQTLRIGLHGGGAVGGGHGQFQVSIERNRTQKWIPFVVLFLGGVLIAAALLVGDRESGDGEADGAPGDRKEALRLKENLLTSVANLDDRMAAGGMERRQYQRRRADLMQKLEDTVRRLGSA